MKKNMPKRVVGFVGKIEIWFTLVETKSYSWMQESTWAVEINGENYTRHLFVDYLNPTQTQLYEALRNHMERGLEKYMEYSYADYGKEWSAGGSLVRKYGALHHTMFLAGNEISSYLY